MDHDGPPDGTSIGSLHENTPSSNILHSYRCISWDFLTSEKLIVDVGYLMQPGRNALN